MLIVREVARRGEGADGTRLVLADRSGAVDAVVRPGSPRASRPSRRAPRSTSAGAACAAAPAAWSSSWRHCAPPRTRRSISVRCSTARRARPPRWRRTCARSSPRCRTRTCAGCSTRSSGPARRRGGASVEAPAAKRYHQAYRHGLLEHSLSVAQAVSAISATFPGIDRDVAVTGALLHDIGKLDAYTADPLAIDMTDLGRLQGEIALGYFFVRRLIEDLPGFPPDLAGAVLHIILVPPRLARARVARGPVHARGDARAHDRQPRGPARLLRPAREGAARRQPLVGATTARSAAARSSPRAKRPSRAGSRPAARASRGPPGGSVPRSPGAPPRRAGGPRT